MTPENNNLSSQNTVLCGVKGVTTTEKTFSFYTYVFLDPRKAGNYQYGEYKFNFEPYYVGKGTGDRIKDHIREINYGNIYNPFKARKMKKIIKAGFNPIDYVIKVIENIDVETAFSKEKYLVKIIGRKDLNLGPLTNLTDGGDGLKGVINKNKGKSYEEIYGKEIAEKMRKDRSIRFSGKRNPMFGKESSLKGCKLSKEKKQAIRERLSVKVNQLDKYGNLIKTWDSISSAAKVLNIGVTSITNVLSERTPKSLTAAGFYWEYTDKRNEKYYKNIDKRQFYKILSPNGELFYIDSIRNFIKENNFKEDSFRDNALNPKKPRNKRYTYLYDDWNYWIVSAEEYKTALGLKFC